MAINFASQIATLYAGSVGADANYSAITASLRNGQNEQNLLTTIEVVRAYLEQISDQNEAHLAHQCLSHMLARMANDTSIYQTSSKRISVSGNVQSPSSTLANGATISVTTVSGTDAVVLASAPYANMAALVSNINSQLVTATEVQAFFDPSFRTLGFRNTIGNEGIQFTLAAGAGAVKVGNVAGIVHKLYVNPIVNASFNARADAIKAFTSPSRKVVL